MISRFTNEVVNNIRKFESIILQTLGHPPRDIALAYFHEIQTPTSTKKISLKDIVADGFLFAVPKSRRTIEKRLSRKFGIPGLSWKPHVPKTNLIVCQECGHYQERGRLCGNCYQKVVAETQQIQEKIKEAIGINKPIENDVVVLYNGESLPDKPKEFWQGKRIIEMKTERPFFSKNLLQKSTQQPSESTAVKPKELA